MKLFPDAWWLSRPALLRKIVKGALTLLALYCAFKFLGFSFHRDGKGDGTVTNEHAAFSIGTPEPWYHWEKSTEQIVQKTSSSSSTHSSSGFNLVSRSFGSGVLSLLVMGLLIRIGRCEKT